ncbi:MAG: hypothetical protein ABEK17_03760 [Candidatus Aenigmatarchaeota archaeon]
MKINFEIDLSEKQKLALEQLGYYGNKDPNQVAKRALKRHLQEFLDSFFLEREVQE